MNTFKLIILRLYNITFGRIAFFSKILRRILVRLLIKGKSDKYVPSSRYFEKKELNKG